MKLYTFEITYKTRHKALSPDSWCERSAYIHIVEKRKPDARKAALSRFNKMIRKDFPKSLYDSVRHSVELDGTVNIGKDGFLDIYF